MVQDNQRFIAVVGAPRSGTTSLCDFLKGHEDVSFSVVKEPHFFSNFDLTTATDAELRETLTSQYLARFFPDQDATKSTLAEGSVSYLYKPKQMVPIIRAWPDTKFIIAVRDPMELLPSLHQRLLYIGDEVVTDFAKAWALLDDRRHGRKVPRSCVDPRWLLYDEIGSLGKYVEDFMSVVGRERCHVVLFDDLVADPASVYRGLLDFVGLRQDGRTNFRPRRSSRGFKIGFLQRLLKRPPKALRGIAAGEHYRHRVRSLEKPKQPSNAVGAVLNARKRLLKWNAAAARPALVDQKTRENIRQRLEDDVANLGRLINRDLSHWLSPERTQAQS